MPKGLDNLENFFKARDGTKIPQILPSAIGSARSDGHKMVDGTSTIVIEFKRLLAGITALPQVEVAGYVARLDARLAKETYLQWRVPCLGLSIVNCDITFYALLAVDHCIRLTRLTPTLSCIQSAFDGHDHESLYLAFTAASVLQAHILEDAQILTRILTHPIARPSTSEIPAEIPTPTRCYPAISKLLKYPTTPGPDNYLFFEICGVFEGLWDCLLYKARRIKRSDLGSDDKFILIKFMRQYSLDLHQFCAEAGHTPLILGYEQLPGGWYAVAMEYIESGISITNLDLLTSHCDHWMMELRQLINNFHAVDLVHGDLRDTGTNILCKGKSVMLVDFDWGGKVGKVSYLTLDLNPELLKDRVSESLMITKGNNTNWHRPHSLCKSVELEDGNAGVAGTQRTTQGRQTPTATAKGPRRKKRCSSSSHATVVVQRAHSETEKDVDMVKAKARAPSAELRRDPVRTVSGRHSDDQRRLARLW
ncbi:hypothetical protein EDB85DRAFT_1889473 [Lactarius pseudohatsudake]|nr:hypothetical protein EDB85DRAFT_1889473 [Lactarius pseudohatsudake]